MRRRNENRIFLVIVSYVVPSWRYSEEAPVAIYLLQFLMRESLLGSGTMEGAATST